MRGDKLKAIVYRDDPFWGHVRHRYTDSSRSEMKSCRSCGGLIWQKPGQIRNYCVNCEDVNRKPKYGKLANAQPPC